MVLFLSREVQYNNWLTLQPDHMQWKKSYFPYGDKSDTAKEGELENEWHKKNIHHNY